MELFSPPAKSGRARERGGTIGRTPGATPGKAAPQMPASPFLKSPSARLNQKMSRASPAFNFQDAHLAPPAIVLPMAAAPPSVRSNGTPRARAPPAAAAAAAAAYMPPPASARGMAPQDTYASSTSASASTASASAAAFAAGASRRRTAFAAAASSALQYEAPLASARGNMYAPLQAAPTQRLQAAPQPAHGQQQVQHQQRSARVATPHFLAQAARAPVGGFRAAAAAVAAASALAESDEENYAESDGDLDDDDDDDDDGAEHELERWGVGSSAGGGASRPTSARPMSAARGGGARPTSAAPAASAANSSYYSSASSLVPLPAASARAEYVPPREIFSRSDPLPLREHRQHQFQPAPPPSRASAAAAASHAHSSSSSTSSSATSSIRARRVVPDLGNLGARVAAAALSPHARGDSFDSGGSRSSGGYGSGGNNGGGFQVDAHIQRLDRSAALGRRRSAPTQLDYAAFQHNDDEGGDSPTYSDSQFGRHGRGQGDDDNDRGAFPASPPPAPMSTARFASTEAFAAAAFGNGTVGGHGNGNGCHAGDGGMNAEELEAALAFAEKLRVRREQRLAREAREARMMDATNTRVRRPMLSDEVDDGSSTNARQPLPSPSKRSGGDVSQIQQQHYYHQPPSHFEMPLRPAPPPQRPSSAYRSGRPGTAVGGK